MKAIIFDLYETLITEWGRPRYLARDAAIYLDVDHQLFQQEWDALGRDRFLGKYAKVEDVLKKILDNLSIDRDEQLLIEIAQKRARYKQTCFDVIEPKIIDMLSSLKAEGYKIGLISNCSPEEVGGLQDCELYTYLDAVVLSCDVGMEKPDTEIYDYCLSLLGENASDCYFVGDGGSDELSGAERAGMIPLRALWFIKYFAENFDLNNSYKSFYEPEELLEYVKMM